MHGPQTPAAQQLHRDKYRLEGESFRDAMCRVGSALKDSEDHYHTLKSILLDQRFMFGGRIQAAMGSTKHVTPYNCFVSGTIKDSFTSGHGSIMDRATEAADTMRMGGGIGYDFSTLRPRGDLIEKLSSQASGPVSFMYIYDAVCKTVASSGHRRGAQMAVLRVDHPDILEFINVKHDLTKLNGFNLSVGVTNEFMIAVDQDLDFQLKFKNKVYKTVKARDLWETLMRSTWDYGEPGVIFIDQVNNYNNLYYCERISATNPCGEQPLPPYGACLLGSFNLTKYIVHEPDGITAFDWHQFRVDIPVVHRAMDNVVDRAIYPLPEQEEEAKNKRRMGVGVTGVANAGEALGLPYGSQGFLDWFDSVMHVLTTNMYLASIELAKEKGSFPMFNKDRYLQGAFIKSLPLEIREGIEKHGIRNSHLISIAPTGTISQCADNCSSGIEPVFQLKQKRIIQEFDGAREEELLDYGYRTWRVEGRTADKVTPQEHVKVQAVAQKYCDSSVSKTCNVPSNTPWEDFKDIYINAWKLGCKGCTTFTTGGRREGVLKDGGVSTDVQAGDDAVSPEGAACYRDPVTGRQECE